MSTRVVSGFIGIDRDLKKEFVEKSKLLILSIRLASWFHRTGTRGAFACSMSPGLKQPTSMRLLSSEVADRHTPHTKSAAIDPSAMMFK